jgi:hypothetical protein
LVVWHENYIGHDDPNIFGVRIKPTGVILDRTPIAIAGGPNWSYFPKVASDGVDFLVVWDEAPRGGNFDIRGARVQASTGTVLDRKPVFIGASGVYQGWPAIAWNGQQYYVAWTQWTPAGVRIAGTLVSRGGAPATPVGSAISGLLQAISLNFLTSVRVNRGRNRRNRQLARVWAMSRAVSI